MVTLLMHSYFLYKYLSKPKPLYIIEGGVDVVVVGHFITATLSAPMLMSLKNI